MRKPGDHNWIHGLPLKMRFQRSRLYISAIPPLDLGAIVGLLAAVLGAGGGFIIVPAMIYFLRMPTHVVDRHLAVPDHFRHRRGHRPHAVMNQTLDMLLAFLLVLGGVIGGQFGVSAGQKLKGEQLRAAARAHGARRGAPPAGRPRADAGRALLHRSAWWGHVMRHALCLATRVLASSRARTPGARRGGTPRSGEVQSDISTREISIKSNFTGIEILLFGTIDFSRAPIAGEGAYDCHHDRRGPSRADRREAERTVAGSG